MTLDQLFKTRYLPHVTRTLKPKTVAEYKRLYGAELQPRLSSRQIDTLTLDDAEALHAAVPGKVQANRAVSLLSGMLTYAVRRRLLAVHPCRGVERNPEKGREFFYPPEHTRALLAAASSWPDIRGRYIALELLTGCRPGELLNSGPDWRHGSVLRTPDGKTGGRVIYLPPAACAILDGREPCSRYFPAGMDLRRAWITLCRLAGVPRARLYDLRHTFASAALAAGQSLAIVGEMLGHRKAQTTKRYVHLAPDVGLAGAAAAAERMGA
jgi:integrase